LVIGRVGPGARQATLELVLRSPAGDEVQITAIVDTGFTSELALPEALTRQFGLSRRGTQRALVADGRVVRLKTFNATVLWDGGSRPVRVLAASGPPLVGMAFLRGYELLMRIVEGGEVTLSALA